MYTGGDIYWHQQARQYVMDDPQKNGPWVLIPKDKSALVRSVDPENLPSPLGGTLRQILKDKGKGLGIRECRALVSKARLWDAMSEKDRKALLMQDAMTYADLARSAARVVKVKKNG